eukprot:88377-Rhodomonas_salina.1
MWKKLGRTPSNGSNVAAGSNNEGSAKRPDTSDGDLESGYACVVAANLEHAAERFSELSATNLELQPLLSSNPCLVFLRRPKHTDCCSTTARRMDQEEWHHRHS